MALLYNLLDWLSGLTWYSLVCVISFVIFFVKGIVAFIIGDFDWDFGFDGDVDCDLSDVFSLKGVLHFCMGFTLYLTVTGFANMKSLHVLYNFTVMNYVWAFVTGIIFSLGLLYLYKFTMKANTYNDTEMNYDGMSGQVTLVDEKNHICRINVSTSMGVMEVDAKETNTELMHSIGDYVRLSYNKETKEYFI